MPAEYYSPGDLCMLDAHLYNAADPMTAVPLVVILDVAGQYWFWDDWTSGDVFVGAYLWPNWIASICVPIGVAIMLLRFALLAAVNAMAALTGADPLGSGDDELF